MFHLVPTPIVTAYWLLAPISIGDLELHLTPRILSLGVPVPLLGILFPGGPVPLCGGSLDPGSLVPGVLGLLTPGEGVGFLGSWCGGWLPPLLGNQGPHRGTSTQGMGNGVMGSLDHQWTLVPRLREPARSQGRLVAWPVGVGQSPTRSTLGPSPSP